ncbi:mucin-19-like isoform X13 [Cucumis melo var. makuwa]|uniref:Mucin-19-like isoform X13 n=1 Tax=Cucumis melo var. makuwa TaxID=1194695 RepID=A0A5D3DUQ7_CUCMM|nr:mucin-19-like isoform X13 [Cucumis melo var. makuwa]
MDSIGGHNQVSGKGFPTTGPRIEAGNVVIHRGLHVCNVTPSCSLCAIKCKELFTDRHRCRTFGVSFGSTRLICASVGSTRLICASFGSTRLIFASLGITRLIGVSFGITRLIRASFGITRLICAFYGTTRLLCKGTTRGRPTRGKKDAEEEIVATLAEALVVEIVVAIADVYAVVLAAMTKRTVLLSALCSFSLEHGEFLLRHNPKNDAVEEQVEIWTDFDFLYEFGSSKTVVDDTEFPVFLWCSCGKEFRKLERLPHGEIGCITFFKSLYIFIIHDMTRFYVLWLYIPGPFDKYPSSMFHKS